MKKTRILFGIGMVVAVLASFTASATADNYFYFVPQNSSGGPGESVLVSVVLHVDTTPTDDQIASAQVHIDFNPSVVNITKVVEPTLINDWDSWNWKHMGNYVFFAGNKFGGGFGPGEVYLGNMTLNGTSPGVSPIAVTHFSELPDPTEISDKDGEVVAVSAINGTFTCLAPSETFTKELVTGWNLISLPLTNATNMTVANIMSSVSGKYDALYSYNATTKGWVSLDSLDTMANGVGYFIHMSSAGTWSYTGVAYTAMNVSLQPSLNMFGWLNCSKSISESVASNCNYVARWNATIQHFETCNPVAPPEFNDFSTLERGEGYFISAKAAETLTEACSD